MLRVATRGARLASAIAIPLFLGTTASAYELEDRLGNPCRYDPIRGAFVDATGTQPLGGCLPHEEWEGIRQEARRAVEEEMLRQRDAERGGTTNRRQSREELLATVRNGTVHVRFDRDEEPRTVKLRDGVADEPGGVVQVEEPIAFGDLNGDGNEDAAVILSEVPRGGNGVFHSLAFLIQVDNALKSVWAIAPMSGLGLKVEGLRIEDRAVVLDALYPGPGDALCCPTQSEQRRYSFSDGGLVVTITAAQRRLETITSALPRDRFTYLRPDRAGQATEADAEAAQQPAGSLSTPKLSPAELADAEAAENPSQRPEVDWKATGSPEGALMTTTRQGETTLSVLCTPSASPLRSGSLSVHLNLASGVTPLAGPPGRPLPLVRVSVDGHKEDPLWGFMALAPTTVATDDHAVAFMLARLLIGGWDTFEMRIGDDPATTRFSLAGATDAIRPILAHCGADFPE